MTDEEIREVSADEAVAMVESGKAELVDVRTPEEFEAGHIGGARHIPLDSLSAESEDLPRARTVVFYCRGGNRSAMAAAALKASGGDARKLSGGIVAWAEEERPLEPPDGEVAEHSALPPR